MAQPRPDTSTTKKCSTCKQLKPPSEFYKSKATFDGLNSSCKVCNTANNRKHRAKMLATQAEEFRADRAARSRKWRAENPELAKDHLLKSNYGIPLGTYDRLFQEQGGKCAICNTDAPKGRGRFHVDHCHDNGHVRGLLCHYCNLAIGGLFHKVENCYAAADYLLRTNKKSQD